MKKLFVLLFAAVMSGGLHAAPGTANPLTVRQTENVVKSLDLARPELKSVADAVNKGDMTAAGHAAAQYFRAKAVKEQKPVKTFHKKRAADALAGKVTIARVTHTFKDGHINWKFDATAAPGLARNYEWVWQLGRMSQWPVLGEAYRVTGDEKYSACWVDQLRSWGTDWPCPPEKNWNGPGSGWRTIECGIRLSCTWPSAYRNLAGSKSVTDEDILFYLHLSLEQMRHMLKHPTSGNWFTIEMYGVYVFAADHPEFTESAAARRFAAEKLYTDLVKEQFRPDGAHYELSPGYHSGVVSNTAGILRKAEERGFSNELPPGYARVTERATDYFVRLMTPDRNMPYVNDSWSVPVIPFCRRYAARFPQNTLIRWAANGADPQSPDVPDFTSCNLPWAGWTVFRQNWRKDSHYLLFDAGLMGGWHGHQDKLNLVLYGYGEELLCDDGGGQYEISRYRNYARSSFDHSVVIVDRQGQNRPIVKETGTRVLKQPIDVKFTTGAEADYAEADFAGPFGKINTVTHRRQVIYLKPDFFLVCDRLLPKDGKAHHYQARWQVRAQKMMEHKPGSGILRSDRKKTADLVIAPLFTDGLSVSWGTAEDKPKLADMRGIYVDKHYLGFKPSVTVTHEKTGPGPQTFLTLLCPVKAGAALIIREIAHPAANRAEVTFEDGRKLAVTVPEDPAAKPVWQWLR